MKFESGLKGRDHVIWEFSLEGSKISNSLVSAVGCLSFLRAVEKFRKSIIEDLNTIPLPQDNDHSSLILRKLILSAQGQWVLPYKDEELCHCRAVPTEKVVQAIIAGAHTPKAVSLVTSASTSCGTCRPDVEALLSAILKS